MTDKGCDSLIDQNKIILMTKLEIYNKRYGTKDRNRLKYFMEDYVYIKNFKTRLCFTLVILFILGIGSLNIIITNIVIPESLEMFLKAYINPYILPWFIGIVFYTLISTIIYSKKYKESQQRFKGYQKLLTELDEYEKSKEGALNENR